MTAQTAVKEYLSLLDNFNICITTLRGFGALLEGAITNEDGAYNLHRNADGVAILFEREMKDLERVYEGFGQQKPAMDDKPDAVPEQVPPKQDCGTPEPSRTGVDVDAIARSLNTDRATVEGVLRQLKTPSPAAGAVGKPQSRAVNG